MPSLKSLCPFPLAMAYNLHTKWQWRNDSAQSIFKGNDQTGQARNLHMVVLKKANKSTQFCHPGTKTIWELTKQSKTKT